MGKALKGKMNSLIFPSRAFSHRTVSNRIPHYIALRTLRALATLRNFEGERARNHDSKPTHLHSIAWTTPLRSGIVYGIN